MKSARWIVLILLALAGAWFFVWSRGSLPEPERALESPADPAAPTSVTAVPPSAPEAAAPAPEAIAKDAPIAALDAAAMIESAAQSGIMLYGFVLPVAGGKTLESGAGVGLTDRFGENQISQAGPDGAYSFANLAAGRYWIFAQARSGGEVRRSVELLAADGDRRLDLQLEVQHEILVEVVDLAGERLRIVPMLAVATFEAPGEWCDLFGSKNNPYGVGSLAYAGSDGKSLPAGVMGRLRLTVPPPVYVSLVYHQRVVATQQVELGQALVRFVLDPMAPTLQPGRLRLRFVDALTREPLGGLTFRVLNDGPRPCKSELDGTFSAELLPGWACVTMIEGPYENPEITLRIHPGLESDLGDVALAGPVSISGTLVDDQGAGISSKLRYEVLDPATGRPVKQEIRFVADSQADGTFSIKGLARRRYCLRFGERDSGEYAIAAQEVDARAGSVEGARLQLSRGVPLLMSASDPRWPLLYFEILDARGMSLLSSRLWGPEPRKILLAPGRYALDTRVGEMGEAVRREFTIASVPLELSLP